VSGLSRVVVSGCDARCDFHFDFCAWCFAPLPILLEGNSVRRFTNDREWLCASIFNLKFYDYDLTQRNEATNCLLLALFCCIFLSLVLHLH